MSESFFPTIGSVAAKADELTENSTNGTDQADASADEERPLQEIESLCMKCGEQVNIYTAVSGMSHRLRS